MGLSLVVVRLDHLSYSGAQAPAPSLQDVVRCSSPAKKRLRCAHWDRAERESRVVSAHTVLSVSGRYISAS